MVHCRVILLDGKDFTCEIDKQAKGRDLFEKVCQHISLLEKDYFACSYQDSKKVKLWLKNDKKIARQIRSGTWLFSLEVKFYPCEPSVLQEELTRYQLFLQLRRDIVSAKLPCSFMSYALLGSYVIQSQCGDYETTEHGTGTRYISHMTFAPQQGEELLDKITELHKTHRGLLPADAEFNFLENAKKLALYGVDLHLAKDNTGTEIEIGVCAVGLLLYKNHLRTSRLTWPKILSFSYKWNVFSVKIRPMENETCPTVLEYKLSTDKLAKRLWRIAVEHHTFFRLRDPGVPSHGLMARFSPKYQYSGRTLYQAQLASSTSVSNTLDRSTTSSLVSSRRRVGGSKSLESVLAGYSTERCEQFALDSKRIATLDLKNKQTKLTGATSTNEMRTYATLDKGRSVVESVESVSYGNDYAKYQQASIAMNRGTAGTSGTAGGPFGTLNMYNSQPVVFSEDANKRYSEEFNNGRKYWSQTSNQNGTNVKFDVDGKPLPPYQDDRLTERGHGRPVGDHETWNPYVTSTFVQSSMRSYNAPDGTQVTEYSTSRNGTSGAHHAGNYYNNTIDHDKALSDAILAVTSMNADLSVEKIEIVRTTTVTH